MKKKLKKAMKEFFEEKDSKNEDEVSIKTLLIVFIAGLLIIASLYIYFSFKSERIYEYADLVGIKLESLVKNMDIITAEELNYSLDSGECYYEVNKEQIEQYSVPPLKKLEDGKIGVAEATEISLFKTNWKANRIIIEYQSDNNFIIEIRAVNVGELSLRKNFHVEKTSEWTLASINTKELFQKDYRVMFLETNGMGVLYINRIIICA